MFAGQTNLEEDSMRMLNRLGLAILALLLLCTSAYAEDKCGEDYYGNDNDDAGYSADSDYAPGMTADEANAYGGQTAVAGDYAVRGQQAMQSMPSPAEWALRSTMAKLWEEHIVYTRNVIVGIAAGSPDVPAVVDRLMQNQVDIGNAIKPFYGAAAGNQVTQLLKEHIQFAGDAVKALKANDTAKATTATKNLYANADQIAALLSSANPNWPQATVKQMLYTHLDLLSKQAKAEIGGDWDGSIMAYDQGHDAILKMANALSEGIIKQFPDKF